MQVFPPAFTSMWNECAPPDSLRIACTFVRREYFYGYFLQLFCIAKIYVKNITRIYVTDSKGKTFHATMLRFLKGVSLGVCFCVVKCEMD